MLSLALLLYTGAAHAQSTCSPGEVFPAGGTIPADHVRVFYKAPALHPLDNADVVPRLYRLEGATKVNVPYTLAPGGDGSWLTPTTEQPLGTQLVFELEASCGKALRTTYSITERRALPTTLGTLSATREPMECSPEAEDVVYADLRFDLSAQAQPFAALLQYQLFIDGELHASFKEPPPQTLLEAACSAPASAALTAGVHLVQLSAQLDDAAPLTTPELAVDLRCDG